MEQDKPTFTLKKACPICEQGVSLVFCTCPDCKHVILVCDEENSIFPDPKNISEFSLMETSYEKAVCPNCHKSKVQDFLNSTGEEIKDIGFSINEYE